MNQEQVIELAKKANVIDKKSTMNSEYVRDIVGDLFNFASLVEQATLERAANVCDKAGHHASIIDDEIFAHRLADAIRALKDSHD